MAAVTPPLSRLLRDRLIGGPGRSVTVGELVDLSERQAFGLLLVVLALPAFIPVLPWGTAAAIGALYAFLGAQRLLGVRRPWLPRRVRSVPIGPRAAAFLVERAIPVLERVERASNARLGLATAEPVGRLAGLAVLLLGLIMLSPLPFLNSLPALLALVIGVGFIRDDGLFLVAGAAAGAALFLVVAGMLAFGVGLAGWRAPLPTL